MNKLIAMRLKKQPTPEQLYKNSELLYKRLVNGSLSALLTTVLKKSSLRYGF